MSLYVVTQLRFTNERYYRQYQKMFAGVFQEFSGKHLEVDEQPRVWKVSAGMTNWSSCTFRTNSKLTFF